MSPAKLEPIVYSCDCMYVHERVKSVVANSP